MGKGKGHIPIRTCISCGAKQSKNELTRLTINDKGWLVRNNEAKKQGRGAYICKSKSCLEKLSKNRRLNRVFRARESISISPDLWAE